MNMDKVTQYMEQLAVKLGVAAEHVYDVLVRQQWTEGTVLMVGGLLYLVFFTLTIRLLYRKYVETRHGYNCDWDVAFWAFLVAGGMASISAFACVLYGLMHVLNPEYYAIQEIMEAIGGVVK